jgi:hypothetical protein
MHRSLNNFLGLTIRTAWEQRSDSRWNRIRIEILDVFRIRRKRVRYRYRMDSKME